MEVVVQKEMKPFEFDFMGLLSSGNYRPDSFPINIKSVLPALDPYYSSNFRAVIVNLVWGEWEECSYFGFTCHRHAPRQVFCMYCFVAETEYLSI